MPYLTVRDARASADFYAKAFGFEKGYHMPDADGHIMHAEVHWHDMQIMFGPEGEGCHPPVNIGIAMPMGLFFYVEDVDAVFKRPVEAGCEAIDKPANQFCGDRMCRVRDPDGYQRSMGTNIHEFDPDKVPGATA